MSFRFGMWFCVTLVWNMYSTQCSRWRFKKQSHSISFDQLRRDFGGLRERILMHIGLLTAFNTSLTVWVPLVGSVFGN